MKSRLLSPIASNRLPPEPGLPDSYGFDYPTDVGPRRLFSHPREPTLGAHGPSRHKMSPHLAASMSPEVVEAVGDPSLIFTLAHPPPTSPVAYRLASSRAT